MEVFGAQLNRRCYDLEEERKPENTEENKQPEIDLVDEEGHKEKLEVYEENKEPVKEE